MLKRVLDRLFIWYYRKRANELNSKINLQASITPLEDRLRVRKPKRIPLWPWRDAQYSHRVIFSLRDQNRPKDHLYASAVRRELQLCVDILNMGEEVHLYPDHQDASIAEMYCYGDEWVMFAKLHDMDWLLDQVIAYEKREWEKV